MLILHEALKEEAEEADRTGTADVEVAVPVNGKVRPEGVIVSHSLPGGTMAGTFTWGPTRPWGSPMRSSLPGLLKEASG
jgi:hypothetical protein